MPVGGRPSAPLVTIGIPSPLRELTGGREILGVRATTVDELLARLRESEPLLSARLFADDGSLRGFVNLFLDGADIRSLEAGTRTIERDAFLSIVPSVAGG